MSYLDFYGLSKPPFHVTPDPDFLYLSPSHKEALGTFLFGIARRKGILAVTGEVGVGKTTVLRSYLDQVNTDNLKLIYLFNANMPFTDLVRTLCSELGIENVRDRDTDMLNDLQHALIREYGEGRNVVLIIDEAQNIPYETLENLRMLSNLETRTDKLLQIVLIGQPELQEKLGEHRLRQLTQRIAVRSTIVALTQKESMEYIASRLQKCGVDDAGTVFTRGALQCIVTNARGIPRVINILSDNSLITGYGYQQRPIQKPVVQEVVADLYGETPRRNYRAIATGAALLVFIMVAVLFAVFRDSGKLRDSGKSVAQQAPLHQEKQPGSLPSPIFETALPPDVPVPTQKQPLDSASKEITPSAEPLPVPERKLKAGKTSAEKPSKKSLQSAKARKEMEAKVALERSRKIQQLVQRLSTQNAKQIHAMSGKKDDAVLPSGGKQAATKPEPAVAPQKIARNTPAATDPVPESAANQPVPEQDPVPKKVDAVEETPAPERTFISRVPPAVVRTVKPSYPRSGIKDGLQGTVFLKVLVTERGDVEAVQVLRGIGGNRAFSDSATAAVKRWKFTPGLVNGVRQKMWVTCAIAYQLKG